ncbi:1-acylglycerol-3-phosphate O [Viridothelium virens]|uniref:1-acyl-sn-glycerol-3-phosphate acyltransferase n=1 Tax=Viridothelium virens TaxID=1048519 RepID=A0A6A6GUV6_VIRVR|nr:1-acylglycerol-3-phosphate O [Viridothelium virens]
MDFTSLALVASAAYFLVVVALYALSAQSPICGFYARSLASWAALLICACYGVISSVALRISGYGGLSQWTTARAFKWTMRLFTGVEFVIQGEEHLKTRPAVFIGNHQTELDVLMLGAIFPPYCSVTAKKSLKWVPFLGWFMALSKTVFIDRSNRNNAMAAFETAAQHMRSERQSVYIFPEGTRSYTAKPEMLPFKKGAFHLAVKAQVPIVPIVVANYSNLLHLQSRRFTSGKIPVKVLPPIDTKDLSAADVDDLVHRTREQMMRELVAVTELARSQRVALSSKEASEANGVASGADHRQRAEHRTTQAVAAT